MFGFLEFETVCEQELWRGEDHLALCHLLDWILVPVGHLAPREARARLVHHRDLLLDVVVQRVHAVASLPHLRR
eukprot:1186467-Prorocentrum_minimum.AAC.1